jgi:alpha-L-rhamnosidase
VADPGWSFYVGGVFDEKNPWFIVMPDVNRYLSRVSYLMRQGKPANDVLLYLSNSDAWAQFKPGHISLSDDVGQCLGKEIVGRILDAGYNLDFFDDQMLDRFGRVNGGDISFGDLRYKVVVLAGVERMPLSTLRKLEEFARAGGVLIATRREPAIAPGFTATDADQQEVHDITRRLFHGSGAPGIFVADDSQIAKAMASRLAPDVAFSPPSPQIGFVHRHTDYADIYFLDNTSNRPIDVSAALRIEGETPHCWNPLTGEIKPVDVVNRSAGATRIGLSLDAYESTVIVWDHEPGIATDLMPMGGSASLVDLNTDWEVQFGKDSKPIRISSPGSWATDPATQHFSGVATYTHGFSLYPGHGSVRLEFGDSKPLEVARNLHSSPGYMAALDAPIREVAVVYINNHRAGSVWSPPYELDITHWVNSGDNTVRIEIANTAINSIAGTGFPNYDVKAIAGQFGDRFTPPATEKYKPLPWGLLGNVRLVLTRSN